MPVVIDSFDVVPDSSAPRGAESGQPASGPPSDVERTLDVERTIAHERRRQARVRAH
jgi:hypothetical protein